MLVYDDANCSKNERLAASLPRPPYHMASPLDPNERRETFVKTDERVFTLFRGIRLVGKVLHMCAVPVNYQFRVGLKYDALFDWNEGSCQVQLSQVTNDTVTTPLLLKTFTNKAEKETMGCFAAMAKRRE